MDTFFEIVSTDQKVNQKLQKEVEELISEIDLEINTYNPKSEIAFINQNAGIKEIYLSLPTFKILQTGYHLSEISDGLFDITFQPLQDIYGFENSQYKIPETWEIEETKQKVNYKKMILNEKNRSAYLANPGMKINVSGFMKGYVLDQVKELLNQKRIKNYFLNFGGNLYIHSDKEEKIGIKHPRNDSIIFSFPLKEGFVSTSADYQQFFERTNHRYTHIINPITGSAIQKMQTITVVCNSGILSDFLSTTLFLLDPNEINQKLFKMNQKIEYYAYDGAKEYTQWEKTP
jgi:FAD:protein FMN transferase